MRNYLLEGDFKSLSEIQTTEQDALLAMPNVVGVGLGNKLTNGADTGVPSLLVLVDQKLDKEYLGKSELIPGSVGKFKTDVVEVGQIFAQTDMRNNELMRPAMGGCSVGHTRVTAGTIATTVIRKGDNVPSRYFILSNNHVLANSNAASIGDPIVQPGTFDGGVMAANHIAILAGFVPINFMGGNNVVDCAIAEVIQFDKCSPEIYSIGYIQGVANIQVNTRVQKSGRTTGYTRGRVIAIGATINVNYGGAGVAKFVNQIVTTNMSAGGDSGSLVLDMRRNAVGLLFAGSAQATILNPISAVLSALQIEFLGV